MMTSSNLVCEKSGYQFGLRKPCKRCKITTIDQETGAIENPKEPLATLAKLNLVKKKTGHFLVKMQFYLVSMLFCELEICLK